MFQALKIVLPIVLVASFLVSASRAEQDDADPAIAQPPVEAQPEIEAPALPADIELPTDPPMPEDLPEPDPSEDSLHIPEALSEALRKIRDGVDHSRLRVGDLCEVKHYRQERLQGYGMAVDLKEALARPKPTVRTEETPAAIGLPDLLELLESPLGGGDPELLSKLQASGHLTMVAVTATVPPEGVRADDRLDGSVRSLDGKSLENASLLPTALFLPGPTAEVAPAVAAGPIEASAAFRGSGARLPLGVLVQQDVSDQFVKDQTITLVLKEEHACFLVVQEVVDLINDELSAPLAKALNRFMIEVSLPETMADDPVAFVTVILQLHTSMPIDEEMGPAVRP